MTRRPRFTNWHKNLSGREKKIPSIGLPENKHRREGVRDEIRNFERKPATGGLSRSTGETRCGALW